MMKQFRFLFMVLAMLLSVACNTDDNAVVGIMDDYPSESLPVNDLMTVTTDVPVTILDSDYSDVAKAFINRLKHPLNEITNDTKAILIKGSNIAQHTSDSKLWEAVANGAVIIIDQPTFSQMLDAIYQVYLPGFTDADPGEEEHDTHICYDILAFDNQYNFYELNDIYDEDKNESEQTMSPYMNGLYADPLTGWLNEKYSGKVATTRSVTRSASSDLSALMSAQNYTRTYTLRPTGGYASRLENRQCVFTISTNIWAAYKFDEDADYYMIEQTVLGNNNNFWIDSWTGGKWKYQGFFLSRMTVNNRLFHSSDNYGSDNVLKYSDGVYLLDFSPVSTSGQHTITVEESWNLSGEVGLSGVALSGGVGGSVSSSYNVQDMSITALCGNDNNCYNNAAWQFDISTDNYDFSGWSGYSFRKPPLLGTDAYKSVQCWQWKVEHPKNYGDIKILTDLGFDHSYNSYRNKVFSGESYTDNFFNGWYSEYITIRPPYRGTSNE